MRDETDAPADNAPPKNLMNRRTLLDVIGLGAIATVEAALAPLGSGTQSVQITGTLPW